MTAHWFWFGLTIACLVWYSSITVYVTLKGARDIVTMLKNLEQQRTLRHDAQDQV